MLTGKYMLVAEGVVRDADTNTISVHNIIEEITAEGYPLLVQKITTLAVVERTSADSAECQLTLKVHLGDLETAQSPVAVRFSDKMRSNVIVRIHGLVIPSPGLLTFALYEGSRKLIDFTINAKARRPPTIETSSST